MANDGYQSPATEAGIGPQTRKRQATPDYFDRDQLLTAATQSSDPEMAAQYEMMAAAAEKYADQVAQAQTGVNEASIDSSSKEFTIIEPEVAAAMSDREALMRQAAQEYNAALPPTEEVGKLKLTRKDVSYNPFYGV